LPNAAEVTGGGAKIGDDGGGMVWRRDGLRRM